MTTIGGKEHAVNLSVDWWAVALLFYLLCGFGFTIQGVLKLPVLFKKYRRVHEDAESGNQAVASDDAAPEETTRKAA